MNCVDDNQVFEKSFSITINHHQFIPIDSHIMICSLSKSITLQVDSLIVSNFLYFTPHMKTNFLSLSHANTSNLISPIDFYEIGLPFMNLIQQGYSLHFGFQDTIVDWLEDSYSKGL